jgi:hypothetical protein
LPGTTFATLSDRGLLRNGDLFLGLSGFKLALGISERKAYEREVPILVDMLLRAPHLQYLEIQCRWSEAIYQLIGDLKSAAKRSPGTPICPALTSLMICCQNQHTRALDLAMLPSLRYASYVRLKPSTMPTISTAPGTKQVLLSWDQEGRLLPTPAGPLPCMLDEWQVEGFIP